MKNKAYNFNQFRERLIIAMASYNQKNESLKDTLDEWLRDEKTFELPQNKILAYVSITFCQCAYRVVLIMHTAESRESYHHSIYSLYDFIESTLFTMGVNENALSVAV